jgi:hypothetical protein
MQTRSNMRGFERPTDYVGEPFPGRLNGGPNSPKKKASSFMEAKKTLGLVVSDGTKEDLPKGKVDALPIGMTPLAGPDKEEDTTEYEEEAIIEVEDDSDDSDDDVQRPSPNPMRSTTTRGQSFEETPVKPAGYYDGDYKDRPSTAWEKPDWAKKSSLRSTGEGKSMKEAGNLAKPITSLPHLKPEKNFAKPERAEEQQMRETGKLQVLKTEGNLAKPSTALPQEVAAGMNDYSWEKPDWATNSKLRGTKNAEKLKSGENLSRPIYGIKPIE